MEMSTSQKTRKGIKDRDVTPGMNISDYHLIRPIKSSRCHSSLVRRKKNETIGVSRLLHRKILVHNRGLEVRNVIVRFQKGSSFSRPRFLEGRKHGERIFLRFRTFRR